MTPKQIVILVFVILLLVSLSGNVVQFFFWKNGNMKRELQQAKQKIHQLERIDQYKVHVQKIEKDRIAVDEDIQEADSDEEVYSIISDILNSNNSLVQDD